MSFESALKKTVLLEGGFSNHPADPGNWTGGKVGRGLLKGTKYGISAARYPHLDIENLTLEQAKEIYRRDYWDRLRLSEIENERIQEEIFDTAVNMGTHRAARIVQRAVNFLEQGSPLVEDGIIGPATLAKVNFWCRRNPEALFRALNGYQFIEYTEIAREGSGYEIFAPGWMKRIQDYHG